MDRFTALVRTQNMTADVSTTLDTEGGDGGVAQVEVSSSSLL